jgi:hypothetical protein
MPKEKESKEKSTKKAPVKSVKDKKGAKATKRK